jgi:hypothetical protein
MGSWNLPIWRRKDKAKNHAAPILEPDTAQHGKAPEAPVTTLQKSLKSILSFPDEILILIMHQLPCGALYILRQTCRTFHSLASDFIFNPVLLESMTFMQTRHESHRLSSKAHDQLAAIRRVFTRQSLCKDCLPLFNDYPKFIKKITKLWEPKLCRRCAKDHPRFFFAGRRDRSCMGQKGYFALCEHVRLEADYGKHNRSYFRYMRPWIIDSNDRRLGHLYPRLDCPKGCHASLAGSGPWLYQLPQFHGANTIPMLEIELQQHINKAILRMALREKLERLDYLCVHASDQFNSIVGKVTDTECGCFIPGHKPDQYSLAQLLSNATTCSHHVYNCRLCGAIYTWKRVENHILLEVRIYCDTACSPLSTSWLTNLRYRHKRDSILNRKATKGILWCDDPNCATGSGHRWRNMVQIFHQHGVKRAGAGNFPQDGRVVGTPEMQAYWTYCRSSYKWTTWRASTDYNMHWRL